MRTIIAALLMSGATEINAQGPGAAAAADVPRGLRLKAYFATSGFVLFFQRRFCGSTVRSSGEKAVPREQTAMRIRIPHSERRIFRRIIPDCATCSMGNRNLNFGKPESRRRW